MTRLSFPDHRGHRVHRVRKARRARGSRCLLTGLFAAGIGLAVVTSSAQTAAPGPSLDDLLGLDPAPADPAEPADGADPAAAPEPDVASDPEPAPITEPTGEAFEAAAAQMDQAASRLDGSRDAGLDTQRLQEDVLARLDQLIADAVNNAAPPPPGGGGGSPSGTPDNGDAQPGGEPGNGDGAPPAPGAGAGPASGTPAGAEPGNSASQGGFSPGQVGPTGPEAGPLREVRTEWGALPPRLRDELSNGLDEPFSPVYRRQTEAFYRRLAEDAAQ